MPDLSQCLRTLGVAPGASPETIRQAYHDLVRVWHPDRFHSDERLRQIAEGNLRAINDAFAAVRDYRPAPSTPKACVRTPPSQRPPFASRRPVADSRPARIAAVLAGAALCVFVLTAATRLVKYLREPAAQADSPAEVSRPIDNAPRSAVPLRFKSDRTADAPHPELAVSPDPGIENGTELVSAAGARGHGELVLVNQTDLEAIAKLVGPNRAIARALYLAPGASAAFHGVALGVYSLHAEFGTGLDAARLRFRAPRFTPEPVGPFNFVEVQSERGMGGSRFEVVLRR